MIFVSSSTLSPFSSCKSSSLLPFYRITKNCFRKSHCSFLTCVLPRLILFFHNCNNIWLHEISLSGYLAVVTAVRSWMKEILMAVSRNKWRPCESRLFDIWFLIQDIHFLCFSEFSAFLSSRIFYRAKYPYGKFRPNTISLCSFAFAKHQ